MDKRYGLSDVYEIIEGDGFTLVIFMDGRKACSCGCAARL